MNGDMYELIAIAMRYFFAALMALIALRAWKITITDSRRATELRRMSPQTGRCGEFVVVTGDGRAKEGMRYPVIREGLIGASGKADVRLRSRSVRRSHAFFELTERGLRVRSNNHAPVYFAGRSRREVCLRDGGHITVGRVELLLVLNVPVEAPVSDESEFFETGIPAGADDIFETAPEADENTFRTHRPRREDARRRDDASGFSAEDTACGSRTPRRRESHRPAEDMPGAEAETVRPWEDGSNGYSSRRETDGVFTSGHGAPYAPQDAARADAFSEDDARWARRSDEPARAYSGPFHTRGANDGPSGQDGRPGYEEKEPYDARPGYETSAGYDARPGNESGFARDEYAQHDDGTEVRTARKYEDDPLAPERNDEFDEWLNSTDDDWDGEPEIRWEPQWDDGPRRKKPAKAHSAGEEDDFFHV